MRIDQRQADQLRDLRITCGFQRYPMGSVLVECGSTRVICAVSVNDGVPRWMREQGVAGGWLTCEYQMLPSATPERNQRESSRGGPSGRTQEIQRLIGRSLRAVVDLAMLGERTLQVDCDVIDADGGTRCAAITGACVAVELAIGRLVSEGRLAKWPIRDRVAAVSVGIVDGEPLLDLCYAEDSAAAVDMNVVMTGRGALVEVQGTGERRTFARAELDAMLSLAEKGLARIFECQQNALAVQGG